MAGPRPGRVLTGLPALGHAPRFLLVGCAAVSSPRRVRRQRRSTACDARRSAGRRRDHPRPGFKSRRRSIARCQQRRQRGGADRAARRTSRYVDSSCRTARGLPSPRAAGAPVCHSAAGARGLRGSAAAVSVSLKTSGGECATTRSPPVQTMASASTAVRCQRSCTACGSTRLESTCPMQKAQRSSKAMFSTAPRRSQTAVPAGAGRTPLTYADSRAEARLPMARSKTLQPAHAWLKDDEAGASVARSVFPVARSQGLDVALVADAPRAKGGVNRNRCASVAAAARKRAAKLWMGKREWWVVKDLNLRPTD